MSLDGTPGTAPDNQAIKMQMRHRLGWSRLQCGAGRKSIFHHRPNSCTGQHPTPSIKYAISTIQHTSPTSDAPPTSIMEHSSPSNIQMMQSSPTPARQRFTADAPGRMHREVLPICRTALGATVPTHDHHTDASPRVAECSRVRGGFPFFNLFGVLLQRQPRRLAFYMRLHK
jgi:hypothetical protein